MMGKSHIYIGASAATALAAAGILPVTPAVCGAVVFGSLAPDLDTPKSALGMMLPFISMPLYAMTGHRTATHSFAAVAACVALAAAIESAGYAGVGLAFFVGYVAHIAADLLTMEGCALFYPWSRVRYAHWPAVMTGGILEFVVMLTIVGALLGMAYWLNPDLFDISRRVHRFWWPRPWPY